MEVKVEGSTSKCNKIELEGVGENVVNETDLLMVGFALIRLVNQMNKSFAGMIMNTYFNINYYSEMPNFETKRSH